MAQTDIFFVCKFIRALKDHKWHRKREKAFIEITMPNFAEDRALHGGDC